MYNKFCEDCPAKVAARQVDKVARESAEKIRQRNAREIIEADSEDFWSWWVNNPIQRREGKEPLPQGKPAKNKSSSKNRRGKQPRKKTPVSMWEGI